VSQKRPYSPFDQKHSDTAADGERVPIAPSPTDDWADFLRAFRTSVGPLPEPWANLFGPLQAGAVDGLMVVGQIGQSLDGRIATASGHSKYINGPAGLTHLHQLRALVDAVVIGVGTALADDPQLTVRRVEGPHPARIVIDPRGRLQGDAKVFANDGVRRLVLTAEGTTYTTTPPGVEVVALPAVDGRIAPSDVLAVLAEQGFQRILIEGGAETVSRFMVAGCLDRLHVTVAPIILGAGRASFALPPIDRADEAVRLPVRSTQLDGDLLLDCDLSAQRVPVGRAKRST
jgi:diaminohydroxyphosphoribosylaminopyrimidine deaminase / 5-amino-6-(5-phosphoribosylamino)uracil reductase